MFHKRTVLISTTVAAVFTGVLMISIARSEEAKPAMTSDEKAMMEAYMRLAQPGPEHQKLAEKSGEWTAQTKAWKPDGTDCGTGTGTVKSQMILDGRYLQSQFDGEMMGPEGKMPFKGIGTVGYDNGKKKYVSVWMDDMSTGPMVTEGTADGNVITGTGESLDPMTGKMAPVKDVTTFVDANHYKYELHMTGPDGKLYKCLEVVYTRK
jgi:hypothetical protein